MIEIIPFMLFLIEWHPDRPGEFELQRQPVVFRTLDECKTKGAELAGQRNFTSADGKQYQFACAEIPKPEEIRDAFTLEIGRALERDFGTKK